MQPILEVVFDVEGLPDKELDKLRQNYGLSEYCSWQISYEPEPTETAISVMTTITEVATAISRLHQKQKGEYYEL